MSLRYFGVLPLLGWDKALLSLRPRGEEVAAGNVLYDGEADHDRDADHDVSHCFFYIAPPLYPAARTIPLNPSYEQ